MPINVAQVAKSVKDLASVLEQHRSLTGFGKMMKSLRSERLMREFTFSQEPVDCVLFALKHLKNNEEEVKQALAWLNQAQKAYDNVEPKTVWHELANAVRLDVMVKMHGFGLAHTAKTVFAIKAQLGKRNNALDTDKLKTALKQQTALLGYHLGRGLEFTDAAVAAYDQVKSMVTDSKLTNIIEAQKAHLQQHTYLCADDLGMDQQEFNELAYNRNFVEFKIRQCCVDGQMPKRTEFGYNVTNNMHYGAGLTVFCPPIALFAIPAAIAGTPIFMVIDHVNYHKDQSENDMYYRILDDANAWMNDYLQKQADKFNPSRSRAQEKVREFIDNMDSSRRYNFYNNIHILLDQTQRELQYRSRYFSADEKRHINRELASLKERLGGAKLFYDEAARLGALVSEFGGYLRDQKAQVKHADGLYHPKDCQGQVYAGFAVSEMPEIIAPMVQELAAKWESVSPLLVSIDGSAKVLRKYIGDVVEAKQEEQRAAQGAVADLTGGAKRYGV